MDGKLLLRLERCLRCHGIFPICRCCYRGQAYCDDACRAAARAAQCRAVRATYQASSDGRADHRDRNRELRKRAAPVGSVMDQGSKILAPSSSVCLPQGPSAPMSGGAEVSGRSHDDANPTDRISQVERERRCDEDPGESGQRRGVEGGVTGGDDAASTGAADTARGDGALVSGAGARCARIFRLRSDRERAHGASAINAPAPSAPAGAGTGTVLVEIGAGTMDGATVEINNADAKGRLTLGEAIGTG
jgi:hypothetical protein